MPALELFCIGNALVDQEFLVDDQFIAAAGLAKGTMQLCDAQQQQQLLTHLAQINHRGQASGGSAANTAVAFAALGGQSFYACRVGNDALAAFYLQDLAEAGVHSAAISLSEGTTGSCIVMISPDAERTMYTHLGVSAELGPAQVDYAALARAKWLYIEGYLASCPSACQAVVAARQLAKEQGIKMAMSLSDPAMVHYAKAGLEQLLGDGVELLFCNEQEALLFSQSTDIEQAIDQLLSIASIVVVTLGSRGAWLAQRQHSRQYIATAAVQAIDSNGAGDAFAGAFLYALSQHKTLQQAAEFGNRVAAKVVSQFGPRLTAADYQALAMHL
jgi:sugar/nucleoside kinase (ribokinase family)